MKRRAIAYLRVSTVEQKSGYGLDVQDKVVREHARTANLRLIDIVRDEAISGTKGEDLRPGLAEVLVRLEAGDADVLLVPRLDRLARSLVLQETVIKRLTKLGRDVVSIAEPDVMAEDGHRTLIRQILGAIAEYEAWIISARLRTGREMKRARGGYASGRPPYGFRAEGGELVAAPEEQEAIRLAKRLRKSGLSYRDIAHRLQAEGLHPRSGGRWHPPMVSRLVNGPPPKRATTE